jgi:hypothetical protein
MVRCWEGALRTSKMNLRSFYLMESKESFESDEMGGAWREGDEGSRFSIIEYYIMDYRGVGNG